MSPATRLEVPDRPRTYLPAELAEIVAARKAEGNDAPLFLILAVPEIVGELLNLELADGARIRLQKVEELPRGWMPTTPPVASVTIRVEHPEAIPVTADLTG